MFGIPKRALIVLGVLVGIAILTGLGGQQGSGDQGADAGCQVSVHADILNVRSGPGMDSPVVDKLEQNEEIDALDVVRGGFRKLDEQRWASDEYLEPVAGACG